AVPDLVAVELAVVSVMDRRDGSLAVEPETEDRGPRDAVASQHGAAVPPMVGLDAADAGDQLPWDLTARVIARLVRRCVLVSAQGSLGDVVASGGADGDEAVAVL